MITRIPTKSIKMAFAKSKSIYELLIKQRTQDITLTLYHFRRMLIQTLISVAF